MTDETVKPSVKPVPITEFLLEGPSGVLAAPVIYTDWLGARGNTAGVVNLTLCVHKYMASESGGVAGRMAVVHLRMPLHTAVAIKEAIAEIELSLQTPASEAKN
jgi:hypothetical protein